MSVTDRKKNQPIHNHNYCPALSLGEGKRIAPFCGFVKLPTMSREHTSLTTPMAEDGGFSTQQAQI